MPVTVEERFGRKLSDDSAEFYYLVRGTEDPAAAAAAVESEADATYAGLALKDVQVDEIEGVAGGAFNATASYGRDTLVSNEQEAFVVRGENVHITTSKATVAAYGTTPPDNNNLIGITRDNVEGADIIAPVAVLTVTHRYAASSINSAFRQTVAGLVGKTNQGTFKGFAIGEVLLMGASEQPDQGDGTVTITYEFGISKNATGLTVCGISGITKAGWDYLWVLYEDGTSNNVLVKKARAVYVERVYDAGDFLALNLNP